MVLADRIRLANTRQLLRAFGGLNETYGCSEAEYSAGVNFSTRDFPALSTRTPRRKLRALTGLNGMYHLNGLLTVCGRDVVYTPDDAAAPAVTKLDAVTDGRKALVGIGTKILIFPDKLAFDTADGSVAALGALWTAAGKSVTFAPCDAAGKTYQVEAFGREEPAEPADGQLFLKVEDAGHPWRYDSTLEMYSKNSGSWAAVPLEYCRITAAGLGKLFRQWDTVTVQGAAAEAAGQSPELNGDQIVYDVGEDWLRVRCTPQGEYFYGTLVQNAAAAQWQSMDGKQHRSVEAAQTVSMERRVPELDFVTECDNRVWGCNSRENVIYGCKLGDPTNWRAYQGVATDSYAVTVGTPGPFTGAAVSGSAVIFFKENCLHRVYGTQPSNFTVYVDNLRGVQQGCHKSAVRVNEYLYYKSVFDVCVYADSEVAGISAALGTESYKNAVAGVCGNRLYLSMEDQEGAWQLLVYDTAAGVWTREDGTHALGFASCLTETFMLRADGELYALLPGEYNKDFFMVGSDYTVYAQEETDEEVSWELRTGEILRELPDHKYIGKIQLYLELDLGARAEVALRRDGGAWEKVQELSGGDQRRCTLPIYPRRCDRMEIRLTGVGHARLVNWSKYVGYGSEY